MNDTKKSLLNVAEIGGGETKLSGEEYMDILLPTLSSEEWKAKNPEDADKSFEEVKEILEDLRYLRHRRQAASEMYRQLMDPKSRGRVIQEVENRIGAIEVAQGNKETKKKTPVPKNIKQVPQTQEPKDDRLPSVEQAVVAGIKNPFVGYQKPSITDVGFTKTTSKHDEALADPDPSKLVKASLRYQQFIDSVDKGDYEIALIHKGNIPTELEDDLLADEMWHDDEDIKTVLFRKKGSPLDPKTHKPIRKKGTFEKELNEFVRTDEGLIFSSMMLPEATGERDGEPYFRFQPTELKETEIKPEELKDDPKPQ